MRCPLYNKKNYRKFQIIPDENYIIEVICDWILENQSKSHIRSFEINGFKDLKPVQLAKGSKYVYKNYTRDASIYHLSENPTNFWLLLKFPAN